MTITLTINSESTEKKVSIYMFSHYLSLSRNINTRYTEDVLITNKSLSSQSKIFMLFYLPFRTNYKMSL
jgi:hypothetical protein